MKASTCINIAAALGLTLGAAAQTNTPPVIRYEFDRTNSVLALSFTNQPGHGWEIVRFDIERERFEIVAINEALATTTTNVTVRLDPRAPVPDNIPSLPVNSCWFYVVLFPSYNIPPRD
jgi:hypothetical protein